MWGTMFHCSEGLNEDLKLIDKLDIAESPTKFFYTELFKIII